MRVWRPHCRSATREEMQMYGRLLVVAMCPLALAACETTGSTVATAGAAGALYAARSPGSEIHQIYYLGVLDPTG